ncbi:hypothetical protein ACVIU7_000591 [Bradyrhizobium liaoningense]
MASSTVPTRHSPFATRPLQNRVTPTGDIIATPHRGLFTGNRGIIHDPATKTLLNKRWSSPAWLTCVCEFRGRRREVMANRSWTELFFLDEATALAAGHRPCFFCRRDDAKRFRAAWEKGNRLHDVRMHDIDEVLHRERLDHGRKRLHELVMPIERSQFSSDKGQGAAMVAGGLCRCSGAARQRQALDAALDGACAERGLSAQAASDGTRLDVYHEFRSCCAARIPHIANCRGAATSYCSCGQVVPATAISPL